MDGINPPTFHPVAWEADEDRKRVDNADWLKFLYTLLMPSVHPGLLRVEKGDL